MSESALRTCIYRPSEVQLSGTVRAVGHAYLWAFVFFPLHFSVENLLMIRERSNSGFSLSL